VETQFLPKNKNELRIYQGGLKVRSFHLLQFKVNIKRFKYLILQGKKKNLHLPRSKFELEFTKEVQSENFYLFTTNQGKHEKVKTFNPSR